MSDQHSLLKYASDYSPLYTDRSIPDVAFVDSLVQSSLTGLTYTHLQGVASVLWVITYPVGYIGYPAVTVTDTTGRTLLVGWKYNSNTELEISFARPTLGAAFLKF